MSERRPSEYMTPEQFSARARELEQEQFQIVGAVCARVISLVGDMELRELIAGHFMALQASLSAQQNAIDLLRIHQAQDAYGAGAIAGHVQLGKELGLVEKDPPEPPLTVN